MKTLSADKTVFCPDASDISEFVSTGHDATGKIAKHLRECASCRKEAQSFEAFRPAETIPPRIWKTVSGTLAQRKQKTPRPQPLGTVSCLLSWISSLFRMPVLAIGTAVAVLLVVVVGLYPRHPSGQMIALSSASWEVDLTTKTPVIPAARERVALVVLLKDFKTPMSQSTIDSLYEALKPDKQEQKNYDFVTPSQTKEVISGSKPVQENAKLLQRKLRVQGSC